MKKIALIFSCGLLGLNGIYPLAFLLFNLLGFSFEIKNTYVFSLTIAFMSLVAVILYLVFPEAFNCIATKILISVCLPLSLINGAAIFMSRNDPFAYKLSLILSIIYIALPVLCYCFLTVKCVKPQAVKISSLAVSALLVFPLAFIMFLSVAFGDMDSVKVIRSVDSPSRKYCAEIIDADQGALGGNTLVRTYTRKKYEGLIFEIDRHPKRVYIGPWGEFNNMELSWKDDNTLLINSVEYKVK